MAKDLMYTSSVEIANIKEVTKTFLAGEVVNVDVRSAKVDGKFIDKSFAIITLEDSRGSIEIMIYSEHIKKLELINLEDKVVFEVEVIPKDDYHQIKVINILTQDEIN
ncbi:hypothetical protein [Sulfurimonas sp.]|jgi:DNA polymerase III alpha subunit|uniref:hypothetical protein n=1 Tax=Sulfurimonas sp. TaxID=2022749 RepID=UPI0025F53656|nr:hypothetical protein [Sulfurimonas sp.]MBT5935652.1 hypothetical protein [Sulfurimonas sp.]